MSVDQWPGHVRSEAVDQSPGSGVAQQALDERDVGLFQQALPGAYEVDRGHPQLVNPWLPQRLGQRKGGFTCGRCALEQVLAHGAADDWNPDSVMLELALEVCLLPGRPCGVAE